MWMAILKPLITGKYSQKCKKQPNETQKNTKTEISVKWGPGFYIWLARGAVCTPALISSATVSKIRQNSTNSR